MNIGDQFIHATPSGEHRTYTIESVYGEGYSAVIALVRDDAPPSKVNPHLPQRAMVYADTLLARGLDDRGVGWEPVNKRPQAREAA